MLETVNNLSINIKFKMSKNPAMFVKSIAGRSLHGLVYSDLLKTAYQSFVKQYLTKYLIGVKFILPVKYFF